MKPNKPRTEYIKRITERYREASKSKKSVMLTEVCLTWNIERKHAIKLLNGKRGGSGKKAGRKSQYDERLVKHLTVLWDSMERIHPKRVKAALPIWIPFYRDPEFDPNLKFQLLKMSASTIERFLKKGRKVIKGLSLTRRSKFFRYRIPLTNTNEKIVNVGHVAADTVAHCGDDISGSFAWSLTVTERLTGWTENRSMPDKLAKSVKKAMNSIEQDIPFKISSIQTDCGTEFLNYMMMKYFQQRPAPVIMSRSRPYQKNDNAHVEQKNYTHVRECFGYERIHNLGLVDLMNEIYRDYWNPLHNFFLPQMQLLSKERIGSRIKKKYDFPKTPYERLKLAPNVTEDVKVRLEIRMKSLNPFDLKRGLEQKLDLFFKLLKQGKNGKIAA
jgi:IS30 family transposase